MRTACIIFFCSVALLSCDHHIIAEKNYQAKTKTHKTIAILPFNMELHLNKKQQEIISEKDKAALRQSLSVSLQKKLYFTLIKYASKHKLSVEVQNTEETFDKLSANNVRFSDLYAADKTALLKILNVDAILDPNMVITQQGAAFSLVALFPLPSPYLGVLSADKMNLNIYVDIAIKDKSTDSSTFWKYQTNEWYQAANKIKKNKKEASDNFLAPLFLNIDDIFAAFLEKLPYQKALH